MDADCDASHNKTMKTEVDAGKEEEGGHCPTNHMSQPHWADAREMYEKSRGCQKFSKHLREAEICRSFRAGAGLFIEHEKFWVGRAIKATLKVQGLCAQQFGHCHLFY